MQFNLSHEARKSLKMGVSFCRGLNNNSPNKIGCEMLFSFPGIYRYVLYYKSALVLLLPVGVAIGATYPHYTPL